jgi:hypothetical protein
MGIRNYVFASRAERNSYEKLARAWSESYEIQSNLPFLNVLSIEDINLSNEDADRLKKTSIDFTLCDKDYRPILSIEFDGLYDGVNVGSSYFSSRDTRGKWRRKIMELKIAVAKESGFPFFVVGSEHFSDISPELKFTIVDGIIGDVLARRALRERVASGFVPEEMGHSQESFDSLSSRDQYEVVQDWLIGVEVETELDHNPVSRLAAELSGSLHIQKWGTEYKYFPEVHAEPATMERGREMNAALYIGASVTLHTEDCGDVTETAMLPNFQSSGYGCGAGLAETIAELVCLSRVAKMRGLPVR